MDDHTVTFRQLRAIGDAVDQYYQSAGTILPTKKNFDDWLWTLPPSERATFSRLGMIHCWRVPAFRRFVYEEHGHSLDEFLRKRLTDDEFSVWMGL